MRKKLLRWCLVWAALCLALAGCGKKEPVRINLPYRDGDWISGQVAFKPVVDGKVREGTFYVFIDGRMWSGVSEQPYRVYVDTASLEEGPHEFRFTLDTAPEADLVIQLNVVKEDSYSGTSEAHAVASAEASRTPIQAASRTAAATSTREPTKKPTSAPTKAPTATLTTKPTAAEVVEIDSSMLVYSFDDPADTGGQRMDFRNLTIAFNDKLILFRVRFNERITPNGDDGDTFFVYAYDINWDSIQPSWTNVKSRTEPNQFLLSRSTKKNGMFNEKVYMGPLQQVDPYTVQMVVPAENIPDIASKEVWLYSMASKDRLPDNKRDNYRLAGGSSSRPTATPIQAGGNIGSGRLKDGAAVVSVPGGKFTRGADAQMIEQLVEQCSNCETRNFADALPKKSISLSGFRIHQTEVTNAMYARCVEDGDCDKPDSSASRTRGSYYGVSKYDDYPVIYVSWSDAVNYCAWAGGRLPSEAEWEKAARGTNGRLFPWGSTSSNRAKANVANVVGDTTAVGSYPQGASPYGALDMAGNVYEWTADWYRGDYYGDAPSSNPGGPSSGEGRVIRGGSSDYREGFAATLFRDWYNPKKSTDQIGFRCVVDGE